MPPATKTPNAASQKPDWAKGKHELENDRRRAAGEPLKRRKWPWVVFSLLILGGGGIGAFVATRGAPSETAPAPVAAIGAMQLNPDEQTTIAPQRLERRVKVIGTLEPAHRAQLSNQTGGLVESVTVSAGDRVKAGDVLVQVDVESLTLELQAQRSTAEATRSQLSLAQTQLDRASSLVKRGVGTTSTLDEAGSSVASLRANLSALDDQVAVAELRLRNATLRAPFDGIVSERNVDPGQYVTVGAPLMTIVDLSALEMQANAAVGAGALLAPGQSVAIAIDGIEGASVEGNVTRINPVAQEGTRTIPVYIAVDNSDGRLLGGMFATGQIVVDSVQDAIAVPTAALRQDQQGTYVLGIEDGKLARQAVTTGGDWGDGLTRITDGLTPGQTVVTAPLPALHAGDSVELVGN